MTNQIKIRKTVFTSSLKTRADMYSLSGHTILSLKQREENMTELVILLKSIEKLRKQLNDLINAKSLNLQDPEIIAASEILDDAISKFNEILINMKDK
jgi:hypothetical protein